MSNMVQSNGSTNSLYVPIALSTAMTSRPLVIKLRFDIEAALRRLGE
jgi:hypothetical protein